MTRLLLKKQMMEMFSGFVINHKNGKKRSKVSLFFMGLLFVYLFAVIGFMFYAVADTLSVLTTMNLTWLYFAIMGLMSMTLGIVGSVFTAYSGLYEPKDNDFLLSMPIPPRNILTARLAGVYIIGFVYELLVLIPAEAVYFIHQKASSLSILFTLLLPFVLSLLVLAVTCILGFLIALIMNRIRHKNLVTMIFSVAFLGLYFYFCSSVYTLLQDLILHADQVGNAIKSAAYPVYQFGKAAEGNLSAMIVFTLISLVSFFAVYLILSRTFLKLATTKKGNAKEKYVARKVRKISPEAALLKKEFYRFFHNPNYMLNCGMSSLFMTIGAVAAFFLKGRIDQLLSSLPVSVTDYIPLFSAAALCMMIGMNDISAPSVSLEGKNIWIVQTMPVDAWQVLKAKLLLHLTLTLIPCFLLSVSFSFLLHLSVTNYLLVLLSAVFFIVLTALWGLFLNLKIPNLVWVNELVPIKQGMSVGLSLLGSVFFLIVLGAGCFFTRNLIAPAAYLLLCILLFALLSFVLYRWIRTRGAKIFSTL